MIEKFKPTGQVPPYAVAPKSDLAIGWDGAPLLVRANGKTGKFVIGTREVNAAIYMQLLDWRYVEESRWGGVVEWWLDILFLDSDRQVCLTPLRHNAASRMGAWLKGLQSDPLRDYIAHAVWLRMELLLAKAEVGDREETFFLPEIIDFGWVDAAECETAGRWLDRFVPDENIHCWILPGDVQPTA
jgi:hypothetical protein